MGENHKYSELRDKFMEGLNLAIKKLIERAKINNDELVITNKEGKIVHVKARDIPS